MMKPSDPYLPKHHSVIQFAISIAVLLAGTIPAAGQGLYGSNLVVNGGAESAQSGGSIPGWKIYGSFTTKNYDSPDGISSGDAGPVDRGNTYFIGGSNGTAHSYAEQVISLAGVEPGVRFYFSAFVGKNFGIQDPKQITAKVSFLNDKGDVIQESLMRGPANGDEYDMPGGLVLRATSGFLTTGVTQAKVTIDLATGDSNTSNGFAADNISLVLSQEALIGVNLVVNGGGEVPDGASLPGWTAKRPEGNPVPGWNSSPAPYLTADQYSSWGFGSSSPAPSTGSRGQYILAFNSPRSASVVSQSIEIPAPKLAGVAKSKLNELIDSGKVTYSLNGWLGQYKGNDDPTKLRVSFFDGTNPNAIATAEAGPVRSADHGGDSGLVQRETGGTVPAGTQRILVEWLGTKESPPTDNMQLLADNISLVLSAESNLKLLSISNAATGMAGSAVAPGEMVTLAVSGLDLKGSTGMQMNGRNASVKTSLAGVSVAFDDVEAPLLYVSANELGAIVPFEVAGRDKVPVELRYMVDKSAPLQENVVSAVPGIFTQEAPGSGNTAGLIWNSDWNLNSNGNPAPIGSTVTVFWTGGGQTDPAGVTGRVEMQGMEKPMLPVSVKIGGVPAEVVWAGAVPNSWAGLLMAEVKVPDGVDTSNPASVVITLSDPVAGDISSPDGAATMWVQ